MRVLLSIRRSALRVCLCLLPIWVFYAGRGATLPSLPTRTSSTPTPATQADAVCARCHADITRRYLRTPHAMASGEARANLIPGVFTQPATGVTYTVGEQSGIASLSFSNPYHSELHGSHPLQAYLGSGHLGVTYLYSVDGYLFESPVAYYTRLARYDMKPGLAAVPESSPAIPIDSSCLRCHMSGVAAADRGTLNHYMGPAFRFGGVLCESCHGDASAHVQSNGKAPIVNPTKLTAERRDSVCMSCHLEGDVSVEKNHRSALDFRPGDSISQYLSFFVYDHAGVNARGVSEVEQFAASHCKRDSGDSMSCTSCHDPHFVPSTAERVTYYRAKCLSCHGDHMQGAAFAATHHPDKPDCTSCHMPRSTAENIPHVAWTDHRILARPDSSPVVISGTRAASDDSLMLPIFSPAATPRDLSLALYSAVMDGHPEYGPKAFTLLTQAQQLSKDDTQVLNALGTLANMKGNTLQANQLFASVLAIDPEDRLAATNLAVLQARIGNLAQARALLEPVFDRNQDLPAVAENLAAIDCLQGDASAARTTLQVALRFSPGSHELQQRLAQIGACRAKTQ
jgi:hypothetical protein